MTKDMKRYLCLILILLSGCSAKINLTQVQREQKKIDRFNISRKDVVLYTATLFVGYGVTENYIKKK